VSSVQVSSVRVSSVGELIEYSPVKYDVRLLVFIGLFLGSTSHPKGSADFHD
jgi:hypothetical protein